MASRIRREDGAAAVEFAIVSTILFMIVFGILEFGRTYSQYEVLQGAAREGARRAAVGATLSQVQQAVTQAADPYTLTTQPALDRTCNPYPPVRAPLWGDQVALIYDSPVTRTIKGVFRCE